MDKIKNYLQKNIIIVVVILSIIDAFVLFLMKNPNPNSAIEGMPARIIMIIIVGFLLWWLGLHKTAGLQWQGFSKSLRLGIPFFIVAILILISSFRNTGNFLDVNILLLYTLNMILVGIHEELLVRGFILNTMLVQWKNKKHGILLAVIISSLIFGFMHLTNLTESTLISTFVQILYATFIGIFFASIFVRTKNLYGLIIIHTFIDWCFYFTATCFETTTNKAKSGSLTLIVGALLFMIIGLFYVRKIVKKG